jgi:tetratricopeptide (TPR) repeat protein
VCIICLCNDPDPIQSGCACRGDAGLAHVECRAEAASHRTGNGTLLGPVVEAWWNCATCGQNFTGAMHLGLAEAWWSKVKHLPKESPQRLNAANSMANALNANGKYAKAETMHREVLEATRLFLGPDSPQTLTLVSNLAAAIGAQGKHTEAVAMYREVLVARQRVLGPEHKNTLETAVTLANTLADQGKYAEAATTHREVLVVARHVFGHEHPLTLMSVNNLAGALGMQGENVEAAAMYREVREPTPICKQRHECEHSHCSVMIPLLCQQRVQHLLLLLLRVSQCQERAQHFLSSALPCASRLMRCALRSTAAYLSLIHEAMFTLTFVFANTSRTSRRHFRLFDGCWGPSTQTRWGQPQTWPVCSTT